PAVGVREVVGRLADAVCHQGAAEAIGILEGHRAAVPELADSDEETDVTASLDRDGEVQPHRPDDLGVGLEPADGGEAAAPGPEGRAGGIARWIRVEP